jgi:hypothetical protein
MHPRTIHFTELPEAPEGDELSREWNAYRKELPRLLSEGQERRFVLLKGDQLIGTYYSWDAARTDGLKRYSLEPFMVKQVLAQEPVLRVRGCSLPCRT